MGKGAMRAVDCVRKMKSGSKKKINTTLYDLVEAVMEEVGSQDRKLVTPIVLRLLGKAKPASIIQ